LDLGFEVHWNVLLALDDAALSEYCFQDADVLLMEFSLSMEDAPQGHEQMIYRLQRSGYQVVIAHPERYPFVQRDLTLVERWRDMGCALQLDAICLKQNMEPGSKQAARRLFDAGLIDYLASDAHCVKDYVLFDKAVKWAERHG
jgi:protein-tyrosine phosphatase